MEVVVVVMVVLRGIVMSQRHSDSPLNKYRGHQPQFLLQEQAQLRGQ